MSIKGSDAFEKQQKIGLDYKDPAEEYVKTVIQYVKEGESVKITNDLKIGLISDVFKYTPYSNWLEYYCYNVASFGIRIEYKENVIVDTTYNELADEHEELSNGLSADVIVFSVDMPDYYSLEDDSIVKKTQLDNIKPKNIILNYVNSVSKETDNGKKYYEIVENHKLYASNNNINLVENVRDWNRPIIEIIVSCNGKKGEVKISKNYIDLEKNKNEKL